MKEEDNGCYQYKPLIGKRVRVIQENLLVTIGDLTALRRNSVVVYSEGKVQRYYEVILCEKF